MKKQRTIEDFLAELEKQDLTLADWSRRNSVPLNSVYAVVNGRLRGMRGATRKIMGLMGLPLPPMHRQERAPQEAE